MIAPGTPERLQLRPLNLGEMLDRAVTLFVRNFPSFALIGLVYMLPLTIMQFFVSQASPDSYQQLLDQIQHPGRVPPASLSSFPWSWLIASLAFSLVCTPFVVTAYAVAVAFLYRGVLPEWRAAYGPGLHRAGSVILAEVLTGIIFVFLVSIFSFGFVLLVMLAVFTVRASPVMGVFLGAAGALCALAFAFLAGIVYLSLWFAVIAIVVEGADVGSAVSRGFARLFTRPEFGRALLLCLCFFAIYLGNFLVTGGVSILLDGVAHMRVLDTIVLGILQLCFLGFWSTLLAVYYFDVRIRREGFDIQSGLEELDAPPAA